MGNFTNFAENKLLDHVLKNTPYTRPTNLYLALCTSDPGEAATGSSISEPTGGSYARKVCDSWAAAVSRASSNASDIEYDEATADWGLVTHWAVCDAITGGNALIYGAFGESVDIETGDVFAIAAGDLDVSFNTGGISTYLANKLIDHVLANTPFSQPSNIYVALASATIDDDDNGSTITEPGDTYARQNINAWNAAANGASANTNNFTFPKATAGYGTMTYWALLDALTAGNVLIYAALTQSKVIGANYTPRVKAGEFIATLD